MSVLERINPELCRIVRWLSLGMVGATLAIVIMRYAFGVGAIGLQESVMYMHGLLFLLGIPYGISQDTHVRVDIVYARLSDRRKAQIDLTGHLIFLIPVAVFILYTSLPYTAASWRVWEGSPEVGGIPGVFLLKTLIPLTAALMLLQAAVEVARRVRDLRTGA